jgi:hypothetical protein
VFLFGFSILRLFFNGLFGTRPKPKQNTQQQAANKNQTRPTAKPHQKKIIDSDEGEYIEYEEIKD